MDIIYTSLIIFAVLLYPVWFFVPLKFMSMTTRYVNKEVRALGLPPDQEEDVLATFKEARGKSRSLVWIEAVAPVVTFVALLFTKRSANELPRWAQGKWGQIGERLNGDGRWLEYNGKHITLGHDVKWEEAHFLAPSDKWLWYSNPSFRGTAYYCPWFLKWLPKKLRHPRSFMMRWTWVGFRNRAGTAKAAAGIYHTEAPEAVYKDEYVSLTRLGRKYKLMALRKMKFLPLRIRMHYGYKFSADNLPRYANPTAIGWSVRGGK